MGWIIVRELWPFVNGLLGAFTIFVLVRRQMIYLTEKKKMHKILATTLVLVEVITIIVVPVYLISLALIGKIQTINMDISVLTDMIQQFEKLIKEQFNYDLLTNDNLSAITGFVTKGVQFIINQAGSLVITFIVMLFILYFMLVDYRKMEHYVYELLPFSEQNRKDIAREINIMVTSNAIGIPVLAIVQGVAAYIGYFLFGVPSAFFFAFLTCLATIVPLVGTSVIWVPLVVYLAIIGDWFNAIALAIYCSVVVINIDNLIRSVAQKKLSDTHPLITIFGVILGLYVFGFWGVIFGPLLMSLFFLMIDIFKREYLDK
jgi:predicted PurR-regulated permease PerM